MVLESIIDPEQARKNPSLLFVDSLILSTVCLFVSYYVFQQSASMLNIAFITFAFVPILSQIFKEEEEKEAEHPGSSLGFLSRHSPLIGFFGWMFLGIVVSYAFWYLVLPATAATFCFGGSCVPLPSSEVVFKDQLQTIGSINSINAHIAGQASFLPAQCKDFWAYFKLILVNNESVLMLAILFSFIFGAGAIFIIAWNASVLGVKIGTEAAVLSQVYGTGFLETMMGFAQGLFNSLARVPYGIFEIPGFFVGAIAGGIISIAVTKKKYHSHEFRTIAKDALFLTMLAAVLIVVGAAIEAYLISLC